MTNVGDEAEPAPHRSHDGRCVVSLKLPGAAAVPALEMGMLRLGKHVKLLASDGGVAVADVAQLLQDVERSIHRRRSGVGVSLAAALDQLATGDVAPRRLQDLEDEPTLRRPT